MSEITRFAVRSSGRDVTLVRRPARAVVMKPAKAVATPVTVPDQGAVTVTPSDAGSGDVTHLGVAVPTTPKAKPAKASK